MSFDKSKNLSLIAKGEKAVDLILDFLVKETSENGEVSIPKLDRHQVLASDVVWMKSELLAAQQISEWAARIARGTGGAGGADPAARVGGDFEGQLANFYTADVLNDVSQKILPHMMRTGLTHEQLMQTVWSEDYGKFIAEGLSPESYEGIAKAIEDKKTTGDYGYTEDQNMIRDTFRKFAEDEVMPLAEKIHRHDLTIPENILNGLRDMGCFGLSIPQQYGGFQDDAKPDNSGMMIVTEELSRGSLGAAGSLITRPEILAKALLKGGTEEQKQKWLPLLASGERMAAVAVTEPDFGSDVAGMKVTATKTEGGWLVNGVKTWCTFAGLADSLLVLARTNPDPKAGHKGLSILIAEKPRSREHEFSYDQPNGGHIEGKAIPTIGYRGMHSYEVSFQNYFVPDENLIGGEGGLGKGFYLQMAGFAGGRLQTAARAVGLMQATFEKALQYSTERVVFKQPIINYQMTKYRLTRSAAIIQACRQLGLHCARLMDEHKGTMEASLVKLYASKIAEWVAREAMQLHGGMGYAEEFAVSRYYVDARVFSIFEGAEDVLALRVIIRALLDEKLKK